MENNLNEIMNKKLKEDWSFEQRLFETSGYNKHLFSYFANKILSYGYAKGNVEFKLDEKKGTFFLDAKILAQFEISNKEILSINLPVVHNSLGKKQQVDSNLMIKIKVTDKYSENLVNEAITKVSKSLNGNIKPDYIETDFYKQYQNESQEEKVVEETKKVDESETVEERKIKIYVSNLVSEEHRKTDNILEPVLDKINVNVYDGDIMGVYGTNDDEVELFMQIFGNMRPFYKGSVKLSDYGVKQNKKELMENLYYIDSASALYGRMTVLEQLMFACSAGRKLEEAPKKQKELLDILVSLQLKDIALEKISTLKTGEKLLVQLLVSWISKSTVIIANLHKYSFKQEEIEQFVNVVNFINSQGVTIMISVKQPKFIGMVCKRVLFLVNGQVEFDGTVDLLTKNWDRVVCMMKGNNLEEISSALENEMRHTKCVIEDDTLYVRNHDDNEWNLELFYSIMKKNGFEPSFIKFNKGRVENSFNELMVKYDL